MKQATDAKSERDILMGHIYEMTRRLTRLEGSAEVDAVAADTDASGCGAAGAERGV